MRIGNFPLTERGDVFSHAHQRVLQPGDPRLHHSTPEYSDWRGMLC